MLARALVRNLTNNFSNQALLTTNYQFSKSYNNYAASEINVPGDIRGPTAKYVKNLFRFAHSKGILDVVRNDIKKVSQLQKSTEFKSNLNRLHLSDYNLSDATVILMETIVKEKKSKHLGILCENFENACKLFNNEKEIQVIVAQNLTKEEEKSLNDEIRQGYLEKNEKIKLDIQVDPSIIGGKILIIDNDKVEDYSVKLVYDTWLESRLSEVNKEWDTQIGEFEKHFEIPMTNNPTSHEFDKETQNRYNRLLSTLGYSPEYRLQE